jgi:hypothetical protein
MRLMSKRVEQWPANLGCHPGQWIIYQGRKGKVVRVIREEESSAVVEVETV